MDLTDNAYQRNFWIGKFGNEYIQRNKTINEVNKEYEQQTGITVKEIFNRFFNDLDRNIRILEFGCNIGLNLLMLKNLGFENLYGVEINEEAVQIARKKISDATIINSSIEDFTTTEKFDVVFTAGVLIHINPNILSKVIEKMIALSSSYIFGFEYFSEKLEAIPYRGNLDTCWKQNFFEQFMKINSEIKCIKKEFYPYKNSKVKDVAYLLKLNS